MVKSTVGKWGKNLAVRVPAEVTRLTGLDNGESVEVETLDGDIVIRRRAAQARARANAAQAAAEIIKASAQHPLGEVSIRELLEEGRRE